LDYGVYLHANCNLLMVVQMTMGEQMRYLKNLPRNMERELSKTNESFIIKVIKSAKLRVPKDTGSLKEDIKRKPVRKGTNVRIWKIVADNPAAAPQEFGFTPHFAPILNSSKMAPGIYFVRKNTPFMLPAIEHNLSTFAQQLNNSAAKGIMKT